MPGPDGAPASLLAGQSIMSGQLRPLEIEAAYYNEGVLLLSDAGAPDGEPRLLALARDASGGGGGGGGGGMFGGMGLPASRVAITGLRDVVTISTLKGHALAMSELPIPASLRRAVEPTSNEAGTRPLFAQGEVATQHVLPRRRYVVVCNTGVLSFAKNRPVDILQQLLESGALSRGDGFTQLQVTSKGVWSFPSMDIE